jgi:hypothetical protein
VADLPHLHEIRSVYARHGLQSLRKAFDALDGRASYDDLKLVRVVMMGE